MRREIIKNTDEAVGLYNTDVKNVSINAIMNEGVKDESGGRTKV